MARDSCLARITAGVAVGGAIGGAVGAVYGTYEAVSPEMLRKICFLVPPLVLASGCLCLLSGVDFVKLTALKGRWLLLVVSYGPGCLQKDFSLPIWKNSGTWTFEDQIHWTNHTWQCCHLWSFPGCWELDTLWEIILICSIQSIKKSTLFCTQGSVLSTSLAFELMDRTCGSD
ncbi:hypothetical protein POTOM_002159 [Populus tomentosa]|uniref:Uncharacterized protein n=1 Tax=Populus tomentosa TaxID=118781 RepID=A0A8X8IWI6_POPTO|nr:hypothetical protein POTOM_002159 [Populus tomentosa]